MTTKRKSSFRDKVTSNSQRQQTAGASYGYLNLPNGVSVFSPEPGGKCRLDFLPYEVVDSRHPDLDVENDVATKGSLWYKRPFRIHRNVGSDNDTIICPKSFGKKCPICEYRDKRQKEGAEKDELGALKNSLRNLYVVVPSGMKEHDEKPHIMDISQAMFQKLLNEELEENPDYGIFPDLEEGLTLKIRFDSKTIGKGNPFAEADRIDFEEREEQYTESILKKVPNLDEILHALSYEELSNKFFEIDEPKDDKKEDEPVRRKRPVEEEPEEEKPIRKRREEADEEPEPPVRKRRAEPEPEEEKPIRRRTPEPEPEEEEPKPMRRKAPVKEEEPEEEPKPTRSKEKESSRPGCPHGHKFGVDTDKFDDCDSCKVWNDCIDKKEGN